MKCYVWKKTGPRRSDREIIPVSCERKARALVQSLQGQGIPAAYCCSVGSARRPANAGNALWRAARRR